MLAQTQPVKLILNNKSLLEKKQPLDIEKGKLLDKHLLKVKEVATEIVIRT